MRRLLPFLPFASPELKETETDPYPYFFDVQNGRVLYKESGGSVRQGLRRRCSLNESRSGREKLIVFSLVEAVSASASGRCAAAYILTVVDMKFSFLFLSTPFPRDFRSSHPLLSPSSPSHSASISNGQPLRAPRAPSHSLHRRHSCGVPLPRASPLPLLPSACAEHHLIILLPHRQRRHTRTVYRLTKGRKQPGNLSGWQRRTRCCRTVRPPFLRSLLSLSR